MIRRKLLIMMKKRYDELYIRVCFSTFFYSGLRIFKSVCLVSDRYGRLAIVTSLNVSCYERQMRYEVYVWESGFIDDRFLFLNFGNIHFRIKYTRRQFSSQVEILVSIFVLFLIIDIKRIQYFLEALLENLRC